MVFCLNGFVYKICFYDVGAVKNEDVNKPVPLFLVINKLIMLIPSSWHLSQIKEYSSALIIYRGVQSKWDIFIKMRIAESPPSLDLERSFYNKSILFLDKNHFFFYYLKLLIPLIPLIQGFEDLFSPPFCFCPVSHTSLIYCLLQQNENCSKACTAHKANAATLQVQNRSSHFDRTALYELFYCW